MGNELNYNPYCELCTACGEDGCCSHISCFSTLVQNPKCKYGRTYVADAILNNGIVNMVYELTERLKKEETYTKDDFLFDFEIEMDKLYDKRFDNCKDDEQSD
jgi:hypothetical protein